MTPLWRQIQRQNFTKLQELADFLELDNSLRQELITQPRFPLNLPRRLAAKIQKNILQDPILRQFVPLQKELENNPSFSQDPLEDASFRREKKLLHKYEGRALLLATGACAMNCRFCFRQNFPYETEEKGFAAELHAIAEDTTISEVLLSGGDPLSLGNQQLEELIAGLNQMAHVKRIRFHTRFPVGIPERIDEGFLQILAESRAQIIFALHINHVRELDLDVIEALKKIQRLGIPILTQTVLLQGVNDQVATLQELFEALINQGIIPYYLHQLDRVVGTTHFEVEESQGKELLAKLRTLLPGYAIPQYVREIPGESSKSVIQR